MQLILFGRVLNFLSKTKNYTSFIFFMMVVFVIRSKKVSLAWLFVIALPTIMSLMSGPFASAVSDNPGNNIAPVTRTERELLAWWLIPIIIIGTTQTLNAPGTGGGKDDYHSKSLVHLKNVFGILIVEFLILVIPLTKIKYTHHRPPLHPI